MNVTFLQRQVERIQILWRVHKQVSFASFEFLVVQSIMKLYLAIVYVIILYWASAAAGLPMAFPSYTSLYTSFLWIKIHY